MLPVSAAYLRGTRVPHRQLAYIGAWSAIPPTNFQWLDVVGGSLTIDSTADVRRAATLQVVLSDKYAIDVVRSTLNPYTAILEVWSGMRFADGQYENFLIGTLYVEEVSWTEEDRLVEITASDSMSLVRLCQHFPATYTGTSILAIVNGLLHDPFLLPVLQEGFEEGYWLEQGGNPAFGVEEYLEGPNGPDAWAIDIEVDPRVNDAPLPSGGLHYDTEDRIEVIHDLLSRLSPPCEIFCKPDSTYLFTVRPVPKPTDKAVPWIVDTGDAGALIGYSRTISRLGTKNAVRASNAAETLPLTAWSVDSTDLSPTEVAEAGWWTHRIDDANFDTQAKVNAAADKELTRLLQQTSSLELQVIPNPALEAGDVITVAFPYGESEKFLIESVEHSLTAEPTIIRTRASGPGV
jgi:hypothetical protein